MLVEEVSSLVRSIVLYQVCDSSISDEFDETDKEKLNSSWRFNNFLVARIEHL